MKHWLRFLKKKATWIGGLSTALSLLLFFQNCGDVNVNTIPSMPPPVEPLVVKNINGTICHSIAASSDSAYRLSSFYILNLTAHKFNGELQPDNNLDGMIDMDAVDSLGDTVLVSDVDNDEDGIPDFVEQLKGMNPTVPDAEKDGVDLDGIINRRELQLGTDPAFNGDEPSIDYTVQPAESVASCGGGQPAYKFVINNMQLTPNRAFNDTANTSMYSLSHGAGENVLIVLAKLSPDDVRKPSLYITKIFKIDIANPTTPEFSPQDFLVLGQAVDDCPGCASGVTGNIYKKVFAGKRHTCALSTSNSPVCWGDNSSGQLGDATSAARVTPVKVKLSDTVSSMALGAGHTCAITYSGEVYCWGDNSFGQLGINSQVNASTPAKVNLQTSAKPVLIMAGANHTCVTLEDNTMKCWGRNDQHQLGNGNTSNSFVPVSAVMPPAYLGLQFPIVHVSASGHHNCLTGTNGASFCWGKVLNCSLPSLSRVPATCSGTTEKFPKEGIRLTTSWEAMETNGFAEAGIEKAAMGRLTCWGRTIYSSVNWGMGCGNQEDGGMAETDEYGDVIGNSTEFTNIVSRVIKLKMGPTHSCAVWNKIVDASSGAVKRNLECWGDNTFGALAQPVTGGSIKENPTTVSAVVEPLDVASGDNFSCAIDKDGVIWCWGLNNYGQLGTGDIADTSVPVKVKNQ